MKKKLIAGMLCLAMVLSMTACGASSSDSTEETTEETETTDSESDIEYIQDKGTLVVGITDFAPMDYKDESGEWIGFDADMAKLVGEKLGVEVEFLELIDWDNKILELNSKNVDVIWNGMTLTTEVTSSMECTNAYCKNAQVVVVTEDKKDADLSELTFAVEAGSAGEEVAEENGYSVNSVASQADALMEVASGTSDAAIIDLMMAGAMIGEGTSYPDLIYTEELTSEEYGVGCRQGSDLAAYINDVFAEAYADGTMLEIAEKYGMQAGIIEQ